MQLACHNSTFPSCVLGQSKQAFAACLDTDGNLANLFKYFKYDQLLILSGTMSFVLGLTAYVILHCLESTSLLLKIISESEDDNIVLRKKLKQRIADDKPHGLSYAKIAYGNTSSGTKMIFEKLFSCNRRSLRLWIDLMLFLNKKNLHLLKYRFFVKI